MLTGTGCGGGEKIILCPGFPASVSPRANYRQPRSPTAAHDRCRSKRVDWRGSILPLRPARFHGAGAEGQTEALRPPAREENGPDGKSRAVDLLR